MQRKANPWDRFYRFHTAPWRGDRALAHLEPWLEGKILELGCGNGKTLGALHKKGLDAIGLDVSWHAVRRLAWPAMLADVQWLPFASATMGTVLDLHCTGHLEADGRIAALGEARRVCKPGGRLLQERLGPDDLRASKGRLEGSLRVLEDGRATAFVDADTMRAEAQAAGWHVEAADAFELNPRIRGERVLRQSLRLRARA